LIRRPWEKWVVFCRLRDEKVSPRWVETDAFMRRRWLTFGNMGVMAVLCFVVGMF